MGQLRRALHQLRWSIAVRGVAGTTQLIVRRVFRPSRVAEQRSHAFDITYGVETSGRISGADLGAGHPHDVHNTAYLAVPPSRFQAAIAQWQSSPGARSIEEYAFVDLGCGKGRALLLASGMKFRECLGVELDPGLAGIAQRNLERWVADGRALCPTRVVKADVLEAELPRLPGLIYLYNPFRGLVLRRLLQVLEAHVAVDAGELDLIYLIPEEAAEFEHFPRFERIWEGVVVASDEDIAAEGIDRYDACQIYRWQRRCK